MTWYFHNTSQEFKEEDIQDNIGFVYIITHISTGRKYIGKKLFTKAKTHQVKGKKKKSRVASDWLKYWGSNKELLADIKQYGEENFDCWILSQCKTKKQLTYWEMHHQCLSEVLIGKNRAYNDNILGKFFTKDLL